MVYFNWSLTLKIKSCFTLLSLFFRSIDWCGCSPHNIRTETFQKLKARAQKSPKMFFARKFEALVDQQPVNELEESIGGLNHSTVGWDSYWLNSYNTLDQGSAAIGQLAKAVVSSHLASHANCEWGGPKVIEVTSLIVSGHHQGEIIMFTVWDEVLELLTKPNQTLVLVEGHKKILQRDIIDMKVGEGWDEREKIFRNLFGAFTPTSKLFLLVKFGQAVEKSSPILQLEYRFSGPEGEEGNTVVGTPWSKGEELVDISKLKLSLVPGVWRVQASHQGQTVATMQFIVLSEDTQGSVLSINHTPLHSYLQGYYRHILILPHHLPLLGV